jgi:hypothetical protein
LLLLLLLMALQPYCRTLAAFFGYLIVYTVGRAPWMGISPSQDHCLYTGQHKQNKHTETSVSQMGFKPMTLAFKLGKTLHALDCAATVIGIIILTEQN